MIEKDALYAKEDFTDEDGLRSAELEGDFAEMNGWEAESDAAIMLSGLGIFEDSHQKLMKDLKGSDKVKVLLGQALFGKPDILLLDEPTNHLDLRAIKWLENFLLNFENTVIVVSHDRYFLNKVCTHIADLDFKKITIYAGNYDFWRKSSELAQRLRSDQKKKAEDKASELKAFIARFSANASKSSQATSRQKQLEKLELTDLPMSSRKYPFIHFEEEREAGKDILTVTNISKTIDGKKILDNVSFTVNKGDKIVFLTNDDTSINALFSIIAGDMEPDSGDIYIDGVNMKSMGLQYFRKHIAAVSQKESMVTGSVLDNITFFSRPINMERVITSAKQAQVHEDIMLSPMQYQTLTGDVGNTFSGGQEQRILLARALYHNPKILFMDEATSFLDQKSEKAIVETLKGLNMTRISIAHRQETINMAEREIPLN